MAARIRSAERSPVETLRSWLHDENDPGWAITQVVVTILILSSVAILGAEIWWDDDSLLLARLEIFDKVVLWLLVVELSARVLTYQPPETVFYAGSPTQRIYWEVVGRLRFLTGPLNLIDLLSVLAVVPALRSLRALRLLRLLRSTRVFQYSSPFSGLARALTDNRLPFIFALSFLGVVVVTFGTTIYMIERHANDGITTLADGLWWSIVTLTTVGFGDIAPVTSVGRMVAAVLMVLGMFTLALFAGIVGNTMLNVVMTMRQEEFRMSGYVDHVVVCGYDPAAKSLLADLTAELGSTYADRMVVFAKGERPADLPSDFSWVSGEAARESELAKVRMDKAAIAVIVAEHGVSAQTADATTVLTAFTIRRYVARHCADRARPLYLLAEILDSENAGHAQTAGCDEVIETKRVGYALLAHATSMPGTAEVLSRVAERGAQSLYVSRKGIAEAGTFLQVLEDLKLSHGVLVVGYRDLKTGAHHVNPDATQMIPAGSKVLYFSSRAEPEL
ncbi:Potassium voltage-gated channel subfamily KQT [Enhygromyxa salina]|uniref:BK channel n=1 Tax=Enhygromyxa salina TaxID=215803 RepID=A0A0C2D2P7_9BACT|nr:potassium channel family protein [Enhygromyxa salina]KIG14407.1 Potassium voltage-gated channel subfamily KQT [Enhygromyxa salina]